MLNRFKPGPGGRKILLVTVVTVAVLYLGCAGFIWRAMHRPPEAFARGMAKIPGPVAFLLFPFESMWVRARAGVLNVGDPAPDFKLLRADRSEHVQLSAVNKHRPTVLVFGSYT